MGKLGVLLRTNRLAILIEIILVSLPFLLGIVLGDVTGIDTIPLGRNVVLIGGPYTYLGLAVSLVLLWVACRARGARWGDFGLRRPKNWLVTVLMSLGVSLGVLVAVKAIITPLLGILPGTLERDMSRFDVLTGNLPNLVIMLLNVWVTAGFLEEFLFRGYLTHRLIDLQGADSKRAWAVALILSAIIFGSAHAYQEPLGVFRVGAIGLVYGLAYLAVGRNLWPLILSHAMIDSLDMISHYTGG